jgi:hypothetical protein
MPKFRMTITTFLVRSQDGAQHIYVNLSQFYQMRVTESRAQILRPYLMTPMVCFKINKSI